MGVVKNTNVYTAKILQTAWAGAKYELPSGWSFTGAYYHYDQDSFLASSGTTSQGTVSNCQQASAAVTTGKKVGANCAGTLNSASFMVDYQVNKHFDVYGGVQFSEVDGGLSSGFL